MTASAHYTKLNDWFKVRNEPLVIAGPCSAESEEQLFQTAEQLVSTGVVSAIRAGVWKPRTRPNSFEGRGAEALAWLQKVKNDLQIPVATEVANAYHVEECLKAGIDILWIGARTTVNPFYVQEIAEALQGTNIPVFVKNPIHSDIGLWIGALERLEKVGIQKLAAVHRGFYTDVDAPYRNEPKWEMSFALRAKAPNIPIICDPSHIAGKRSLVEQVSQTAMDIDLDGLMIESHITPDSALSDAAQQLTPADLHAMIDRLILRSAEPRNDKAHSELDQLRADIDQLDTELVQILNQRMNLVNTIGEIKVQNDISIFQMDRWFELLKKRGNQGQQLHLSPALIQELFQIIHKYSVEKQNEVFQKKYSQE